MNSKKRSPLLFFTRIMAAIFLIIFVALVICNIFTKDRVFSEKENRILASKPSLSLDHLASGQFMKESESYVNDQFAFRDFWIMIKSTADTILGKKEANGIYLGKNGRLFEQFEEPDAERVASLKQSILAFSKRHEKLKQYLLIAPTAVNIYQNELPAFAPAADQNAYMDAFLSAFSSSETMKVIDVREAFRLEKETNLYYRTDHHWTTTGAYVAFQQAASVIELAPSAVSYEHYPVSADFQGTLSAKSGFLENEKEALELYFPNQETAYTVNYVEEQKKEADVYHGESLKTRDQYAVFFGGNHSLIEIQTASKSKASLLVLKDSYANCFIPFLIPYYREIVIVDPRYNYDNIDTLIDEYDIQEVLFLYNANTFFSDKYLQTSLEPAPQEEEANAEATEQKES